MKSKTGVLFYGTVLVLQVLFLISSTQTVGVQDNFYFEDCSFKINILFIIKSVIIWRIHCRFEIVKSLSIFDAP